MKNDVVGGYTSYYRAQIDMGSDGFDPYKCHLESMRMLGFSKLSREYLCVKFDSFRSKINDFRSNTSALIRRLTNPLRG